MKKLQKPLPLSTGNPSVVEKMADSIDNAAAALDDINLGEIATGFTSWGSSLMSNIVNKTKSAAENVITTLDPGMTNFMADGLSETDRVNIVVCSSQQVKIEPVSEAFKRHWPYGSVHVKGVNVQPKTVPDQPIGANAALTGCRERIAAAIIAVGKARELASRPTSSVKSLDSDSKSSLDETGASKVVNPPHCYLAVENYIDQILPDQWFDISCLLLKDVRRNVEFLAFSQAIPVPNTIIEKLKLKQEALDKSQNKSKPNPNGYDYTVGKMMVDDGLANNHRDWHEVFGGVSRRTCIYQSARTLAHQYISLVYRIENEVISKSNSSGANSKSDTVKSNTKNENDKSEDL